MVILFLICLVSKNTIRRTACKSVNIEGKIQTVYLYFKSEPLKKYFRFGDMYASPVKYAKNVKCIPNQFSGHDRILDE